MTQSVSAAVHQLIDNMRQMEPTRLSFAAEAIGQTFRHPAVVKFLISLLNHEKAYVREGALYGLYAHLSDPAVRTAIETCSQSDVVAGIRQVALDILEDGPNTDREM